jgi:cobalt-precorrin-5B (C1)-methyltransferase
VAAYTALVTGEFPDPVEIPLPKGERPRFPLAHRERGAGWAAAGVVKDAGDDPDVTHGALVLARVRAGASGSGVSFRAGAGVGTVTKPGLPLAVGEPAINPAPRQMMRESIERAAGALGGPPDVEITLSIPGGEALAQRTWNPRLGIVGGLSVLGTTGVVHPYSCSAWIASIHRGIDVCRANGVTHAAACTGSTSEAGVRRLHALPDIAIIDMGDFAGATLKYLRRHPIARFTIAGGFAKLAKLAVGHLDLHSDRSEIDRAALAVMLEELGAPAGAVEAVRHANTANEILAIATGLGLPLGERVAALACAQAQAQVGDASDIEVAVFDRAGELVGRAPAPEPHPQAAGDFGSAEAVATLPLGDDARGRG